VGTEALVNETRTLLLEDGLKTLWTAAQWHSVDMKLQREFLAPVSRMFLIANGISIESCVVGVKVFWKTISLSSIPFVPFVGAGALYTAFTKILENITLAWGIRGCRQLIRDSEVRNVFLQGCFNVTVGERIGVSFLKSIDIFGPLSVPQTAIFILKMICGVSLIYEKLFWKQKNDPGRELDIERIREVAQKFQKSKAHWAASQWITTNIDLANCYSKDECCKVLQGAVDLGRNPEGKNYLKVNAIVD
jgi:hypothetical protein